MPYARTVRWLNARGTLFNDGGSIFMTGSNASLKGYPEWSVCGAEASSALDAAIRANATPPA